MNRSSSLLIHFQILKKCERNLANNTIITNQVVNTIKDEKSGKVFPVLDILPGQRKDRVRRIIINNEVSFVFI